MHAMIACDIDSRKYYRWLKRRGKLMLVFSFLKKLINLVSWSNFTWMITTNRTRSLKDFYVQCGSVGHRKLGNWRMWLMIFFCPCASEYNFGKTLTWNLRLLKFLTLYCVGLYYGILCCSLWLYGSGNWGEIVRMKK